MVYTLTLNPALDYVVHLPSLGKGSVLRTEKESIFPGGKGINVSIVLSNLGIKNTALGFVSGFTGEIIESMLSDLGINTDFVRVEDGFSRINVKIKAEEETEINANGPKITSAEADKLISKLDRLEKGDILIVAGSVPKGIEDIYTRIAGLVQSGQAMLIADTTGNYLTDLLRYEPFLIKPNNYELEEIFQRKIETDEDTEIYARKLIEKGAQNVYVSMGAKGAMLVTKNSGTIRLPAPQGQLINSTGAGDSSVAGFVAGYLEKRDLNHALKLGVASGSATAFSEGLAEKDEIYKLMSTL